MAAVASVRDGLALTGAVPLGVPLVRSVRGRGVDGVAAVLVDIALVQNGVIAAADHDRARRRGLIGAVRPFIRLRGGLRRPVMRGAAAAAGDGLALTGAIGLVVGLVCIVGR